MCVCLCVCVCVQGHLANLQAACVHCSVATVIGDDGQPEIWPELHEDRGGAMRDGL